MFEFLNLLLRPLVLFEKFGLSPVQAFIVVGMLTAGAYAQWRFQHIPHAHDDNHDE
jgi:hypothetical protein